MTPTFRGLDILTVEAGTVIKNGDEELTVTEDSVVSKGRQVYMTEKSFEKFKELTRADSR